MDSREVFEAWVASNGRNIEHFSDGSYKSMTLDKEWEAWQAANAQAVPEGFVVVPKECPDPEFSDALFSSFPTFSDENYTCSIVNREDINPEKIWALMVKAAKAQAVSEIQQDKQAEIDDLKAQLLLFQADTKRIDFLADKSQSVANVMLPTEIVEHNLSSLRDTIDETMMIDGMRYDVTNSISGEDAKLAWAKGQPVQVRPKTPSGTWGDLSGRHSLDIFGQGDSYEFRLKPRTILINGIEVPCCGTDYQYGDAMYILNGLDPSEYSMIVLDEIDDVPLYWWHTEDEIKQVVAALRQVFVVGPIIEL